MHGHQMHQRSGRTQLPRRSRNGQARAGVEAGVCDAMRFAWFRVPARCEDRCMGMAWSQAAACGPASERRSATRPRLRAYRRPRRGRPTRVSPKLVYACMPVCRARHEVQGGACSGWVGQEDVEVVEKGYGRLTLPQLRVCPA